MRYGTIKINYHIKNIPQSKVNTKENNKAIKSNKALPASSSLNIFTKSTKHIINPMLKGM